MKALTIWQPWATLIMAGAKPYEFRRWDYRTRERSIEGQRIVIHAGARPLKLAEVKDILVRIEDRISSLIPERARPLLDRICAADRGQGIVPLAAGLGTAVLGKPRRISALFKSHDSDRIDHHMWAWPLTEIEPWIEPIPVRGLQGFWNWPFPLQRTPMFYEARPPNQETAP